MTCRKLISRAVQQFHRQLKVGLEENYYRVPNKRTGHLLDDGKKIPPIFFHNFFFQKSTHL